MKWFLIEYEVDHDEYYSKDTAIVSAPDDCAAELILRDYIRSRTHDWVIEIFCVEEIEFNVFTGKYGCGKFKTCPSPMWHFVR